MEEKILQVYNPNNLPTLPYTQLMDFQGDLKHPIEPDALEKMRGSLKKHGVFIPKFVWFDDDGNANILDGHQTKQGLASLEAEGWTIPPIPYVNIEAASREDAAEKLLQINSEYAKINPNTTWLDSFNFPDISGLLGSVVIPEINVDFHSLSAYETSISTSTVNASQHEEPVFHPETSPQMSSRFVSDEDIEKNESRLNEHYKHSPENVEVLCPSCGEAFFLNKEELRGLLSV